MVLIGDNLKWNWQGYDIELFLEAGFYDNGRLALLLIDKLTGVPFITLTCNLPEEDCAEHEIWIKNTDENEGAHDWLLEQELIESAPVESTLAGCLRVKMTSKLRSLVLEALLREGRISRR